MGTKQRPQRGALVIPVPRRDLSDRSTLAGTRALRTRPAIRGPGRRDRCGPRHGDPPAHTMAAMWPTHPLTPVMSTCTALVVASPNPSLMSWISIDDDRSLRIFRRIIRCPRRLSGAPVPGVGTPEETGRGPAQGRGRGRRGRALATSRWPVSNLRTSRAPRGRHSCVEHPGDPPCAAGADVQRPCAAAGTPRAPHAR